MEQRERVRKRVCAQREKEKKEGRKKKEGAGGRGNTVLEKLQQDYELAEVIGLEMKTSPTTIFFQSLLYP